MMSIFFSSCNISCVHSSFQLFALALSFSFYTDILTLPQQLKLSG
uniref:Uncharacterized protein n=1 Tax=Arundo donax TaxID=35708 RepID=A0A0A9H4N1_ARUDO